MQQQMGKQQQLEAQKFTQFPLRRPQYLNNLQTGLTVNMQNAHLASSPESTCVKLKGILYPLNLRIDFKYCTGSMRKRFEPRRLQTNTRSVKNAAGCFRASCNFQVISQLANNALTALAVFGEV